jgi:outer membrane lipoprotein-sorting protein
MKKTIYYFLAFVLTSTFIQAQTSEKATKLLNEVSTKMASYENMYIKFKYTLENTEVDIHQESLGDVYTQKEKYKLNFMSNTFLFDGNNTYVIVPEDEEINVVSGDSGEEMLTPTKLLSFYKEGFNYEWGETKTINNQQIQFIKLFPIDNESESTYFIIKVDLKTKNIISITDKGMNGTQTIFEIQEFKSNQKISENLFTFDRANFEAKGYTINE